MDVVLEHIAQLEQVVVLAVLLENILQLEKVAVLHVQTDQQIQVIHQMPLVIVVIGNVIVDIIKMEVVVLLVELENIVAHDQVAVVQQMYDIMQIHHVARQHVQINQQTHIIHLMHHLMHVVGLVMHDIIKTEVLVLLVELENGVAHDQLVVVI